MKRLPLVPSAYVVYRGASAIDGSPIVAVLTGLDLGSQNAKTGPMAQLAIYPDNGSAPSANARDGADVGVCGDCPMRPSVYRENGAPRCYVSLGRGYDQSFKARAPGEVDLPAAVDALRGKPLRLGAYGDPSAIPESAGVVQALCGAASTWTGYTHAWRKRYARWLRAYCMASADSSADVWTARAMEWRTFRVSARDVPIAGYEVTCPHVTHGVQCATCGLCAGMGRPAKSIVIAAH